LLASNEEKTVQGENHNGSNGVASSPRQVREMVPQMAIIAEAPTCVGEEFQIAEIAIMLEAPPIEEEIITRINIEAITEHQVLDRRVPIVRLSSSKRRKSSSLPSHKKERKAANSILDFDWESEDKKYEEEAKITKKNSKKKIFKKNSSILREDSGGHHHHKENRPARKLKIPTIKRLSFTSEEEKLDTISPVWSPDTER